MNEPGAVVSLESKDDTEEGQANSPAGKTPAEWHQFWTEQFTASGKRMRQFNKAGNKVVKRFTDERQSTDTSDGNTDGLPAKLNLFHQNITTLQSMLYGSTPKIEVSREHQDPDDDIARVASVLYQRILEADVQSSGDDLATALRASLQDRLLPGIGQCRVTYDFETEEKQVLNPATMELEPSEELVDEMASVGYVHWQDYQYGWGRTWSELPWMAYRAWMTKDEAKERFGEKKAEQLSYENQNPTGDKEQSDNNKDDQSNVLKAPVWEIWHKISKKVFWYCKTADVILDEADDPLNLDGFWPSPMPMMANLTTTMFVPKADFVIDQDQYNEIDILYSRIRLLVKAVRVVGVYDKAAMDSVGRMLTDGVENTMIPVDNWAMFAESGGLQGKVDWFPLEQVVSVLQTLRTVLGEQIDLLYQVTGMSDIMSGGNTEQYTSDGTQQLKAKMGSIRIQALQDEFARFASDLDGLKAEIISKHYEAASIAVQSSAQFLPKGDLEMVAPAIELMKSPEIKWRIQIRPESIAMVDYAQLKSERTEFLTAISTFLQSMQAVVQSVPGSLPVMLEMLKWGMAGFKGGAYLEGIMDRAIDEALKNPPQDDNKEGEAKAAQAKADMDKIQAKAQADMQVIQAKGQAELEKANIVHQNKMKEEQSKFQNTMQAMMADLQGDLKLITSKLQADLQVEQAQAEGTGAADEVSLENDLDRAMVDHDNAMTEMEQGHENTMEALSKTAQKGEE